MQSELPKLNKDLKTDKDKNESKKSTKITVGVAVLLLLLTLSYGYLEGIDLLPYRKQTASTKTAELKLTYTDCASDKQEDCAAISASLEPGDSVEKTFEVDNDGSKDIEHNIYLLDLMSTFKNEELVYKLENLNTGEVLISETPVPYRTEPQNELILEGVIAKARTKNRYKLTITYLNKDYNQTENMDAEFSMKVGIELKQQFTITFDANGGEVSTTTKNVNYGETYGDLPEPTYDGYEFLGWFTELDGGAQITSEKMITIIENQTLYAHWEEDNSLSKQTLVALGITSKGKRKSFVERSPLPKEGIKTITENSKYTNLINIKNDTTSPYIIDSETGTFTSTNKNTYTSSTISFSPAEKQNYYFCYEPNEIDSYDSSEVFVDDESKGRILYNTKKCVPLGMVGNTNIIKFTFYRTRNDYYENPQVKIYISTDVTIEKTADTDSGVYELSDDYGKSYYFRGAVENNYIKYGKNKAGQDMWWRIIRINGDGTLRIMYDGIQGWENGLPSAARYSKVGQKWNNYENDNKYAGWMFGGTQNTASTSKVQAQTNETSCSAKETIDSWYKTNIVDTGYSGNIVDRVFCNDRSIPGKDISGFTNDTALGYGKNITAYGSYARFIGTNRNDPQPIFTCTNKNDAFTVEETETTNGDLTYPVGLITADEIIAAGSGKYNTSNSYYYLYKSENYFGLSMTPSRYESNMTIAGVFQENNGITGSGEYEDINASAFMSAVAPVINLSAEYVTTLIGDGTITNPFRAPGTEV